jgi:hypothetical protein
LDVKGCEFKSAHFFYCSHPTQDKQD